MLSRWGAGEDSWESLRLQGTLKSSPTSQFKSINSSVLSLLYGPTLTSIHDYWKNHNYDNMDICQQSDVSAYWLKATNTDYLTISTGREFRSSFTRWFWIRVFWEVGIEVLALSAPSEGQTGTGGSSSNMAPSHGYWLGALVLHQCATLHDVAVGFLWRERWELER